ncbi:chloride channel protein [Pseudoruegeria sp. HB172150]|uniref:chloride channel protein n=1 Tax=Pseudoruegeria sp. HB172150 TaxID=2721164 RepID=UPI00155751CA|nr:chloride channel protein [Pseudoruegeria sp. HB172150]
MTGGAEMEDKAPARLSPRKVPLRLAVISLLLGLASGAVAAAVYVAMIELQVLIWHTVPLDRWMILPITVMGGVLIGGTVVMGARLDIEQEIAEARDPKPHRGLRSLWMALGAIIAVGFGGVLGPEGGIIALVSQLSAIVALVLGREAAERRAIAQAGLAGGLAGFYHSPIAGPVQAEGEGEAPKLSLYIAGLAGLIAFLFTADFLREGSLAAMYLPRFDADPDRYDALVAILPGLVGAAGGALFIFANRMLAQTLTDRIPSLFWQPVFGGAILGLICMAAPVLLFAGHNEMHHMLELGARHGPGLLIVLGVTKVVLCAVCLGSRWLGGPIFPLCFGGAALGAATLFFLPGLNPIIGVAAGMTGAATVGLKMPILAGAVMIFVLGGGLMLPVFVGALAGWIVLQMLPEDLTRGGGLAH